MATTYPISSKQTLMDVCVQVYGTTQLLFSLAKLNGLDIDSQVSIGDELIYDESLGVPRVVNAIELAGNNISNEGAEVESVVGILGMDGGFIVGMDGTAIIEMGNG